MRVDISTALAILLLTISYQASLALDGSLNGRRNAQDSLKAYSGLVGGWRGTGQPERGKVRGSWRESARWSWKLSKETASLEVAIEKGKYLRSASLNPGPQAKTFVLKATLADGTERVFQGKDLGTKALVLSAGAPGEGVRRITLTPLHDTRFLMKLEAQDSENQAYYQLAEVGYTREGVAFAAGESGPTCIVTEGRGTTPVTYKGKTYYVCCSGCRDLFNENPEAVLAEAAERQKSRDKK
ncbi:hypothetical protein ACYOEI_06190 [Singulisphaera rosea]